MSFLQYYFGVDSSVENVAVRCPFPHRTPGGLEYYEQDASAHIQTSKGLFHCKSCGAGFSETSFIAEVLGCSYTTAVKLSIAFNNDEDLCEWDKLPLSQAALQKLFSFNITPEVIAELHLKSIGTDTICFPVFMFDKLIDIRKYNPGGHPKMKSREGATNGLIIPYDVWCKNNKTTLICAGEKDMAVARSFGFNAITITGGENAMAAITKEFHGRDLIICYDNDATGINAANKLAVALKPLCESVKICTAFHEVCKENKEDITDFFVKYAMKRADLVRYLNMSTEFVITPEILAEHHNTMDLHHASTPSNIGRITNSNIQVVATSEAVFACPTILTGEKYRASEDTSKDTMTVGQTVMWELCDEHLIDLLHLLDNNFTEDQLSKNYKKVLKKPNETYLKIKMLAKATIYKSYVTDMFETTAKDVVPMEYTAYSIDCKLESGKKYLATYKLVPHPYKGQQLIMIITKVLQANDSVSNFKVTPSIKENLKVFQDVPGTVGQAVEAIAEKFKGIIGYNGNNTLITVLDLAYHTVLGFDFAAHKDVRGYLDVLVVGESRMGKSSTAEAMRNTYGLGAFVSLAGNAATIAGLIGGSNKVNGSYQTRAGLIPQNHKGLIIFEELGKSNSNVLTELTDIRSSNEVRITRVSGTLTMPARVRMLSLSNVKNVDGVIKPIASYPHGISIVSELVGTAEDIARYDILCVLADKGASGIDPLWAAPTPFDTACYQARVRWVWSRGADKIRISDEVQRFIVEQANELNRLYGCHIKIFGTEAWKKIARLAIAVAGYLVSTDVNYENLIVNSEHVQYAVSLFKTLYDNGSFKLKEYVEHERRYSSIDEDGVNLLQEIYTKSPALLMHMELVSSTTKNALQAATGMTNDEYSSIMSQMVRGLFIIFTKFEIVPTERFRLGMSKIDRHNTVRRLGVHI
jgi:5S rRNA maturation endonuclease (ribonuclease M5)